MGSCITYYVQTPEFLAPRMTESINIGQYLSYIFNYRFKWGTFRASPACKDTYDLSMIFPLTRTGTYCPDDEMKKLFISEAIPWLARKPKQFRRDMNMFQEMYIADQFSRAIVAWLIDYPMTYTPYRESLDLIAHNDVPPVYDADKIRAFRNAISHPSDKPEISFDTTDPAEVKTLEYRLVKALITRLNTFDVSTCLESIYNNILAGQARAIIAQNNVRDMV